MRHILRRLGSSPRKRGSMAGQTCPELIDAGDEIIAVGRLVEAAEVAPWLARNGGGIADDERPVALPRSLVLEAARQLVAEEMITKQAAS